MTLPQQSFYNHVSARETDASMRNHAYTPDLEVSRPVPAWSNLTCGSQSHNQLIFHYQRELKSGLWHQQCLGRIREEVQCWFWKLGEDCCWLLWLASSDLSWHSAHGNLDLKNLRMCVLYEYNNLASLCPHCNRCLCALLSLVRHYQNHSATDR